MGGVVVMLWGVPLPSSGHHQDCCIFGRGIVSKTLTGMGASQFILLSDFEKFIVCWRP